MKSIKEIALICLCMMLLIQPVHASQNTGDGMETVPDSRKEQILSNIQLELITREISHASIQCFDVNPSGFVAIGLNTSPQKAIYVYDQRGEFQYGYTFNCSGDFGINWTGEVLKIYFVRSGLAVHFDSSGQCIQMEMINESAGNRQYLKDAFFATERKCNGKTYCLESDMGIFTMTYSRLAAIDSEGVKQILYSAQTEDFSFALITGIIILSFGFLAIYLGKFYRAKKRTSE